MIGVDEPHILLAIAGRVQVDVSRHATRLLLCSPIRVRLPG